MLFRRKVREWRLQINNIPAPKQCKNFVQILPHKQTVWTRFSLTQSFNHGANIRKRLFFFQLACKVQPKKSNKSPSSSFLSATSTKQPTSKNLTALHPGKNEFSLSGKDLPPTNYIFFISLWLGFNNTLNVFQSGFHRWLKLSYLQIEAYWDKAHLLYGPLSMNYKLPVAGIELLVEVCHIHSANKQFFGTGKI